MSAQHQGRTLVVVVNGSAIEDDPIAGPKDAMLKTVLSAPTLSVGGYEIAMEAVLNVLSDLRLEDPSNKCDMLYLPVRESWRPGGTITVICDTGYMMLSQRIGERVEELDAEQAARDALEAQLARDMNMSGEADETTVPTLVPCRDNHTAQRDLADGGPLPTATHVGKDTA